MDSAHLLVLSEVRPNEDKRSTTVTIDSREGSFHLMTYRKKIWGEKKIDLFVKEERIEAMLSGSPRFSEAEAKQYGLGPEAANKTRDYYTYLYGLPMKLCDPGTRLDPEAEMDIVFDKTVYILRVTSDIGRDRWHVYLDPETFALVGCRLFYPGEGTRDGEYITFKGEVTAGELRLPRVRKWYTTDGAMHLETETIVALERLPN